MKNLPAPRNNATRLPRHRPPPEQQRNQVAGDTTQQRNHVAQFVFVRQSDNVTMLHRSAWLTLRRYFMSENNELQRYRVSK
jgi:hypothetical protein